MQLLRREHRIVHAPERHEVSFPNPLTTAINNDWVTMSWSNTLDRFSTVGKENKCGNARADFLFSAEVGDGKKARVDSGI